MPLVLANPQHNPRADGETEAQQGNVTCCWWSWDSKPGLSPPEPSLAQCNIPL